MYYSVVSAEHIDGYRLRIAFEDGTDAVVDLAPYTRRIGVFRKLRDIEFFRRFKINADFGVICWGPRGEVDIAPETLYELAGGRAKIDRVAEERAVFGKRTAPTGSRDAAGNRDS